MLSAVETEVCAGLGAAGLGLLAGGFAYASRWPGSTIFGAALTAPATPVELALTFDDGPNSRWTPKLLDTLARREVRASFFLLGNFAQAQPQLVQRIAAAGHLIGSHSWSHPDLALCSTGRIEEELKRTQETLEQITSTRIKYFRPPFGARRPAVFRIARSMGLMPVLWNAMTSDWSEPSPERIRDVLTAKVDRLARRGRAANIVLHDGNHRDTSGNRGPSVTAAAMLIDHYLPTRKFVTLDEWKAVR
jgi:peptidoglycan/xylan/chitin deacetylase (PgdA/CDA1 family)